MQNQENIKFIMDTKSFDVPMRFDLWEAINQDIPQSLFQNHQYKFKSSVSLEVFQSFITYWKTTVFPENEINENNIYEYDLLNQEIQNESIQQIINNKKSHLNLKLININIQKLQNSRIEDKSLIEESIAQHLDDYINEHVESLLSLPIHNLFNIFNHRKRRLMQPNFAYHQIIDHYNRSNDSNIFVLLQHQDSTSFLKILQ